MFRYGGSGTVTFNDSMSNTWVPLTQQNPGGVGNQSTSRIYYVVNPIVGSGHTVTATATGYVGGGYFLAFSGADISSPFDQENGVADFANATSKQPGSVTPTTDNQLVITGLCTIKDAGGSSGTYSIDSGFAIIDQDAATAGLEGGACAYLIQTSAGAVNPTWSWTDASAVGATIATFKAAAGGASQNSGMYPPIVAGFGNV